VESSPSKSEARKSRVSVEENSASSALGARAFYFIVYGLYYLSLMLYSNPLRDIILFKNGFSLRDVLYLIYYVGIHGLAIHYFLTAGTKPGFVSDTETEIDKKAFEMLQIQHQPSGHTTEDEEDDEENIGFPIVTKSEV